eukprot:scaffold1572_cov141-Skeletonema_menzelii.AAC.11
MERLGKFGERRQAPSPSPTPKIGRLVLYAKRTVLTPLYLRPPRCHGRRYLKMPIIVPKQKEGGDQAAAPTNKDQAAAPTGESKKQPLTPVAKRYSTILRDFMAYQNQSTMYPEDHTFTEEELSEVTPDHIIRYFTMKLYGDGDAIPSGKPIKGSHHTLGKS